MAVSAPSAPARENCPTINRPGVVHTETTPVMIIGHGSSGTSILTDLLREHLQIAFGTESQFVVRFYQNLWRYGDLRNDASLQSLVSHLLGERWFKRSAKFGFRTDVESICSRVKDRTYRGVLDAVFGEFAEQVGKVRWGDKTPGYLRHLDVLAELFPEAKYIHVIRDGRDVALSLMSRHFGANNVFLAAHDWSEMVERGDAFASMMPSEQLIEVRYEDLLDRPGDTFARLVEFLRIDDANGRLIDHLSKVIPEKLNQNNHGKWKTKLTAKQTHAFDRIACEQLLRHQYPSTVPSPRQTSTSAERLYWKTHDRICRWSQREYWKDNLYKATLRLKRLGRARNNN